MSAICWARRLALLSLLAISTASAAEQNRGSLVDRVRAVVVSEGYEPIPCASVIDGGAMGVHAGRSRT